MRVRRGLLDYLPLDVRLRLFEIADSVRFVLRHRRLRGTDRADRWLPALRWWRMPVCWARGHRWGCVDAVLSPFP